MVQELKRRGLPPSIGNLRQTIAYILPTPEFDLPSMLGLLIGVKGPIRYDESLRLNTITPTQIGPLSSRDINPASSSPSASTPTGATATGTEPSEPAK